ncbi:MAG TPA: hypothetical protein VN892_12260 [Solirubrobacteraceae bacterium]|nr:hypothetical protein [Solirubrobacteraceae bacterium]
MATDAFVIDLRDRVDLARKQRQAEQALADAERTTAKWRSVVDFLASQLADEPDAQEPPAPEEMGNGHAAPGIAQLVEEVVNRANRPIMSGDVREILRREGHPLSSSSVYNSLRYIALRAERIQQLPGRGVFAPLSYQPEELPGPALNGSSTAATQVSPQTQYAPGSVGT